MVKSKQSSNKELETANEELQTKSAELTSLNEDLDNIKESIDIPLVVVDMQLRITRFNDAANRIFRMPIGEENTAITAVATDIDMSGLRSEIEKVIDTGVASSIHVRTKEKQYLQNITPYRDAQKRSKGAVLTFIDTTEIESLSSDLKRSEERYALAAKGANAGIWDWNIETGEFYMSSVFLHMLRLHQEEGRFDIDFLKDRIHPEDKQDVLDILDAHLKRGFEFNVESRILISKNEYIWVHLRGQAEWGKGRKPLRMAGSAYDITDRRRAIIELTKSNQALERFAYVCSHDLKEPARLIENFTSLMSKQYADTLDNRGRQYLDHIQRNSERMKNMIQDILSYSQVEHKPTEFDEVDSRIEVEKALENFSPTIAMKKINIDIGELPKVRADRTQIYQIFLNLLSNAIKFMDKPDPAINIGCSDNGDHWQFFLKDNGIGMEETHAKSIFQVFKQLDSEQRFSGTGIGLSICKRVVEKHQGKIWVKSQLGEGSTFYFTIPKSQKRGLTDNDEQGYAETG